MSGDVRIPAINVLLNPKRVKIYDDMIRDIQEREARQHGHEVGQESECGACVAKAVLES